MKPPFLRRAHSASIAVPPDTDADVSDDLHFLTGPIRPGATPVHVYNDGLVVLMYDVSREKALKKSKPAILFGAGRDEFRDKPTRAALDAGHLLVYGMPTDSGTHADVVVGAPLTDAERAGGAWLDDAGWLDLPSGQLAIHSYNTLPIGDPTDEGGGALVTVPPGRYRVQIHRKDWSAMDTDWHARGSEAGLGDDGAIDDVIVLVPLADGDAPPAGANILFGDCIDFDPNAVSASSGTVADGVFRGRVIQHGTAERPSLAIDLTQDHATALGLQPGEHVLLETAAGPVTAHFHGRLAAGRGFAMVFGPERLRDVANGTGVDVIAENRDIPAAIKVDGHDEWLRLRAHGDVPAAFAAPVGSAVTLRRGAPDASLPNPKKARFKDAAIHAEVVASRALALAVNVDWQVLRKLVAGEDVRLALDVGGTVLPVVHRPSWQSTHVEAALKQSPLLLTTDFEPHWADDKKNVLLFLPWVDRMIEPEKRPPPAPLPVFAVGTPVVLRHG